MLGDSFLVVRLMPRGLPEAFAKDGVIPTEHIIIIVTAIVVGTLARVFTIKEDYR